MAVVKAKYSFKMSWSRSASSLYKYNIKLLIGVFIYCIYCTLSWHGLMTAILGLLVTHRPWVEIQWTSLTVAEKVSGYKISRAGNSFFLPSPFKKVEYVMVSYHDISRITINKFYCVVVKTMTSHETF